MVERRCLSTEASKRRSRRAFLSGAAGLAAVGSVSTARRSALAQSAPRDDGTSIEVAERTTGAGQDDGLLPANRILTYYGFPTNPFMGILGEYGVNDDLDGLRAALLEQAAGYEAADSSRPVLPGFEVIASVAQADAMADGSYLAHTDAELIQPYVDYTAANDMVLFLDYQFGRTSLESELAMAESWLLYPHVHLALDPEFKMRADELPGVHIGQITGLEVTAAQEWLADLCERHGLPPKVLIVHQFHYSMIEEKELIAPVPGVQLVIDMDGHGPPWMKADSYEVVISQQPIEFHGIKLFYPFDDPVMTPAEVLAFDPPPDLIIYQ
jgi:hypothetical protein